MLAKSASIVSIEFFICFISMKTLLAQFQKSARSVYSCVVKFATNSEDERVKNLLDNWNIYINQILDPNKDDLQFIENFPEETNELMSQYMASIQKVYDDIIENDFMKNAKSVDPKIARTVKNISLNKVKNFNVEEIAQILKESVTKHGWFSTTVPKWIDGVYSKLMQNKDLFKFSYKISKRLRYFQHFQKKLLNSNFSASNALMELQKDTAVFKPIANNSRKDDNIEDSQLFYDSIFDKHSLHQESSNANVVDDNYSSNGQNLSPISENSQFSRLDNEVYSFEAGKSENSDLNTTITSNHDANNSIQLLDEDYNDISFGNSEISSFNSSGSLKEIDNINHIEQEISQNDIFDSTSFIDEESDDENITIEKYKQMREKSLIEEFIQQSKSKLKDRNTNEILQLKSEQFQIIEQYEHQNDKPEQISEDAIASLSKELEDLVKSSNDRVFNAITLRINKYKQSLKDANSQKRKNKRKITKEIKEIDSGIQELYQRISKNTNNLETHLQKLIKARKNVVSSIHSFHRLINKINKEKNIDLSFGSEGSFDENIINMMLETNCIQIPTKITSTLNDISNLAKAINQ